MIRLTHQVYKNVFDKFDEIFVEFRKFDNFEAGERQQLFLDKMTGKFCQITLIVFLQGSDVLDSVPDAALDGHSVFAVVTA